MGREATLLHGHGDLVLGVFPAVVLGLQTALGTVGSATASAPASGGVVLLHGLATAVVLVALVVGVLRGRVPRVVVLATGGALVAVIAWLVVLLATGAEALTLFALLFLVAFLGCLVTRVPGRAPASGADRAERR